MLKTVAAIALDDIAAFELGVICEVFGTDRGPAFPRYDFTLCSIDGGPVTSQSGFTIHPQADLGPVAAADLVAVPAHPIGTNAPEPVLDALRAAAARGAMILSVCSGAFLLGDAGLLDGRRCTTHWLYTDELKRRYPAAGGGPHAPYVDEGDLLTSAGTAAGG